MSDAMIYRFRDRKGQQDRCDIHWRVSEPLPSRFLLLWGVSQGTTRDEPDVRAPF